MAECLQSRLREIEVQVHKLKKGPNTQFSAPLIDSFVTLIVANPLWAIRNRTIKTLWRDCIYAPLSVVRKELKAALRSAGGIPAQLRAKAQLRDQANVGLAALHRAELAIISILRTFPAASDALLLMEGWSLCCIYEGDLSRYIDDLPRALELYFLAALVDPKSAYPHNQLSVIAREYRCRAMTWFHYARADSSRLPFAGVPQELDSLAAECGETVDAAAADARVARLGSTGSRELRQQDAAVLREPTGTHIISSPRSEALAPAVLDINTILLANPGATSSIPAVASSISWVLERIVRAAALIRGGTSSLAPLPVMIKQVCTDVVRLLDCSSVAAITDASVDQPRQQLSSMWLVRLFVIAVHAFHNAGVSVEGGTESRSDQALVLVFELISCIVRHTRGVILQARRSHGHASRRIVTTDDCPMLASEDSDDESDANLNSTSNACDLKKDCKELVLPSHVVVRVADLLAVVSAFADWASGHLSVFEGAAELSPPTHGASTCPRVVAGIVVVAGVVAGIVAGIVAGVVESAHGENM